MKISVRVKTRSKNPGVTALPDAQYLVAVREGPHEGKANKAVIQSLATYFKIAPSKIQIVHGHQSRNKVLEIPEFCLK